MRESQSWIGALGCLVAITLMSAGYLIGKVVKHGREKAFEHGQTMREAGVSAEANPYRHGVYGAAWLDGWNTEDELMGHRKITDLPANSHGASLWTGDTFEYFYVRDEQGREHHLPSNALYQELRSEVASMVVREVESGQHDWKCLAAALHILEQGRPPDDDDDD